MKDNRPQPNAPRWSVTSMLRLQDRWIKDPTRALSSPLWFSNDAYVRPVS